MTDMNAGMTDMNMSSDMNAGTDMNMTNDMNATDTMSNDPVNTTGNGY